MGEIGILGASDLGVQISDLLQEQSNEVTVKFYDDFHVGKSVELTVQGGRDQLLSDVRSGLIDKVMIAVGYNHLRAKKALFEWFDDVEFLSFVHHSAWVSSTSAVSEGTVIYPRVVLDARACVCRGAVLNLGVIVAHDSKIGEACFVAPGVTIAGNVSIGDCCYISTGVTIGSGVCLAGDWVVGAGAVVLDSFELPPNEGEFLGGVPARIMLKK